MTLTDLLGELTATFGLPAPTDVSAGYPLRIDGLNLRLCAVEAGVEIIASIDTMQALIGRQPQFMEDLLAANLPSADAGQPVLALDHDNRIVLSRRISLVDLSFDQFTRALGRFVDHLESWHQRWADAASLTPLDGAFAGHRA